MSQFYCSLPRFMHRKLPIANSDAKWKNYIYNEHKILVLYVHYSSLFLVSESAHEWEAEPRNLYVNNLINALNYRAQDTRSLRIALLIGYSRYKASQSDAKFQENSNKNYFANFQKNLLNFGIWNAIWKTNTYSDTRRKCLSNDIKINTQWGHFLRNTRCQS